MWILHSWLFTKNSSIYVNIITGRNEVLAKVMFLHVCVILFTGGVPGQVPPPWAGTPPLGRHPPSSGQAPPLPPLGRHPPSRQAPPLQAGTPPSGQAPPPGYGQRSAGTHPTGMHSCLVSENAKSKGLQKLLDYKATRRPFSRRTLSCAVVTWNPHLLWIDRQTDSTENITFAQATYACGNKELYNGSEYLTDCRKRWVVNRDRNRKTDKSENITFPQTTYAFVNKDVGDNGSKSFTDCTDCRKSRLVSRDH